MIDEELPPEIPARCRWGCHSWFYFKKEADIPEDFPMPPAMVMGMHAALRAQFGEELYRVCPLCKKIEVRTLDFAGCLSISDPPGEKWVDKDGNQSLFGKFVLLAVLVILLALIFLYIWWFER